MSTPLERVLAAITGAKSNGAGWVALCPAHDDNRPSLNISTGDDGRVLLKCHAGCSTADVLAAAGLRLRDLFERQSSNEPRAQAPTTAVYPYRDEAGALVFDVLRREPGKRFSQRNSNGTPNMMGVRRVLYRLPELIDAVGANRTVYVVEGEKDVSSLVELGLVATTNAGGAGKWRPEYDEHFRGANVAIIPDNDDAGRTHALNVAGHLVGVAQSVRIVVLPGLAEKGDVSDWLEASGTSDTLSQIVNLTPLFTAPQGDVSPPPPAAPSSARTLREWLTNPKLLIPPKAVIPNFAVEGRVTLLSGREKVGKSTVVGSIVAAASRGEDVFGEQLSNPVRTLIYSIDEPVADMVRRLQRHEAELDQVVINDTPRTVAELLTALEADLASHLEIDLVVLDTLSRVFAMSGVDPNSSREAEPMMAKLTDFFHRHNVSAIYIYHTGKSGVEFRGSTAIGASVDEVLTLRRRGKAKDVDDFDDDATIDGDRLVIMDGRNLRGRLRLTWVDGEYRRYNGEASLGAKLIETLRQHGPVKTRTELVALSGCRKDDVLRAIKKLVDDGDVVETGKVLYLGTEAATQGAPLMRSPAHKAATEASEIPVVAALPDSELDSFSSGSPFIAGPLDKREPVLAARTDASSDSEEDSPNDPAYKEFFLRTRTMESDVDKVARKVRDLEFLRLLPPPPPGAPSSN